MDLSRERVAGLIDRSRAFALLMRARARMRVPVLSVLCYHSVGQPDAQYAFDPDVIDASTENFRAQLEVLRRYCNVIDIDELCEWLQGKRLPPNPVLITFDDGYRSCRDVALPILSEFGLPATFFIATSYVTQRRLYWWEHIHYLIKRSSRARISLTYPRPIDIDLIDRGSAARGLLALVKAEVGLDLDRFLDDLVRATEVAWSDEIETRVADDLILSWDDIRTMRAAGMDIQSHTRSHRVLQTLSQDQLVEELAGSRADIERELGEPPRTIAYPVGYSIRDQPSLRRAVQEAGYEIGFTNASGVNYLWRAVDPFDIRRMAMEANMSLSMFRGQLAVPLLSYVRRG